MPKNKTILPFELGPSFEDKNGNIAKKSMFIIGKDGELYGKNSKPKKKNLFPWQYEFYGFKM